MELFLVSCSSEAVQLGALGKDNARKKFDLVFELRKSEQVPLASEVQSWSSPNASPFRDRLIIEWLFFHNVTTKRLCEIVKEINVRLYQEQDKVLQSSQRGGSSFTPAITVAVTSSFGPLLSSCFVEKLFQYYSSSPPVSHLTVTRDHMTALNHSVSSYSSAHIWQHYPLAHARRSLYSADGILKISVSSHWINVLPTTNLRLQDAFRKNHLSSCVKIGDLVVNFEGGLIYNKTLSQQSLLRCIELHKQFVAVVRIINSEQYKPFVKRYDAAGILPYSVHPVTGEAIFLIGKITYSTCTWCDFGGLKSRRPIWHINRGDRWSVMESPSETAARECYEETLGVLGDNEALLQLLRDYKTNNSFKVIHEGSHYVGHYVRVPYNHYPAIFATKVMENFISGDSVEVEKMRWINISAINSGIQQKLSGAQNVIVNPINEASGELDHSSSLYLREEFVESLCIAEQLGFLRAIAGIARGLHKNSTSSSSSTLVTKLKSLMRVGRRSSTSLSDEPTSKMLEETTNDSLSLISDSVAVTCLSDKEKPPASPSPPPPLLPSSPLSVQHDHTIEPSLEPATTSSPVLIATSNPTKNSEQQISCSIAVDVEQGTRPSSQEVQATGSFPQVVQASGPSPQGVQGTVSLKGKKGAGLLTYGMGSGCVVVNNHLKK